MTPKPTAAQIQARMKQTAARLAKLKKLRAALQSLQRKRRQALARLRPKANRKKLCIFGIDYAWGDPNYANFHRDGVKFALRYISHDLKKDLDPAELEALHRNGIKVGLVFETTADRALAGYTAGQVDARIAKARANYLGLKDIPIYFGVDFDATPAQRKVVTRYLNGAVSVLSYERVGVYGSYYVVKDAANFRTCQWFWQTYAWSGGLVDADTHVLQYSNGHTLGGVSCDYDHASPAGMESFR